MRLPNLAIAMGSNEIFCRNLCGSDHVGPYRLFDRLHVHVNARHESHTLYIASHYTISPVLPNPYVDIKYIAETQTATPSINNIHPHLLGLTISPRALAYQPQLSHNPPITIHSVPIQLIRQRLDPPTLQQLYPLLRDR